MATLRNLKIKTSTRKQLIKKMHSSEKEVDPYELKQQENALAESRMTVPDCHKRLESALACLKRAILLWLLIGIASLACYRSSANVFDDPSATLSTSGAWGGFRNLSGSQVGQTVDGISKIKNYLKDFRYVKSMGSNHSTDFYDGALEAAIKIYQQNFHLTVTAKHELQSLHRFLQS